MSPESLEQLLEIAEKAMRREFESEVALGYPIEIYLQEVLRKQTPDIGFWGPKGPSRAQGRLWIPGSLNSVDSTRRQGKSLALYDCDILLGIVTIPSPGASYKYTAIQSQGAYKNGKRLQVAEPNQMDKTIVALENSSLTGEIGGVNLTNKDLLIKNPLKNLDIAILNSLDAAGVLHIRRLASAGFNLLYLAEGEVNAAISFSNRPGDMAAGILIAREAGAEVIDLNALPYTLNSGITVAAHPELIEKIRSIAQKAHQQALEMEEHDIPSF